VGKKNVEEPQQPILRPKVIVFDTQARTVHIDPVTDLDEERILTPERSIPIADLEQYVSLEGPVWILGAPSWYERETKHLANVEMSQVIKQLTHFQRPGAATRKSLGLMQWIPWVLAVVLLIGMVVKK